MKNNISMIKHAKRAIIVSNLLIVIIMNFALLVMAETPQTDANSNLPYFISGVERPKRLQYNYSIKKFSSTFNNGVGKIDVPGVIYWPNSTTGLIDSLAYESIYFYDRTTYEQKIRFQIIGTGTSEYPQYYVEVKLQSEPYTIKCVGYYGADQVYNLNDIKDLAPGFIINDGSQKDYFNMFFTETTFPYQPIGGGGGDNPEVKQNIFGSIRDLINNSIFNGEAVQGTIEYNIATLIALICCIAMILLPFLACWGIVLMIIRR